jgi:dTDP-4-dehydrorhamnose 3,5-epimerase
MPVEVGKESLFLMTNRKAAIKKARPEAPRIGQGPILPVDKPATQYVHGAIDGLVVSPLAVRQDSRGWLVEVFRHDELQSELWPRMAYASMTLPGVTRGPHEHVDQTDGFAFFGPSDFRLYVWDTRTQSPTFGHHMSFLVGESNPAAVWIPPGIVHAYRNVGSMPGLVFNAPNRLYAGWGRSESVDEVRHEDENASSFPMD